MIKYILGILLIPAMALGGSTGVQQPGEGLSYIVIPRDPGPKITENMQESGTSSGQLSYTAFNRRCRNARDRMLALQGRARHGCALVAMGMVPNLVTTAGKGHLADVMVNGTAFAKYSGWGTSTQAAAITDTGCVTEATTQYNPDNTRSTGTKSIVTSTTVRITATQNFDQNISVNEFCLMTAASGGANWTRIVLPSTITNPGSITWTYDLTIS